MRVHLTAPQSRLTTAMKFTPAQPQRNMFRQQSTRPINLSKQVLLTILVATINSHVDFRRLETMKIISIAP
jgi:hypothetical protein